jgi:hypothetical protein
MEAFYVEISDAYLEGTSKNLLQNFGVLYMWSMRRTFVREVGYNPKRRCLEKALELRKTLGKKFR